VDAYQLPQQQVHAPSFQKVTSQKNAMLICTLALVSCIYLSYSAPVTGLTESGQLLGGGIVLLGVAQLLGIIFPFILKMRGRSAGDKTAGELSPEHWNEKFTRHEQILVNQTHILEGLAEVVKENLRISQRMEIWAAAERELKSQARV
jgi:hypothetical protein